LSLLNNPEEISLDKKRLEEKLNAVIKLVNNARIDPEIEVDYYLPQLESYAVTNEESDDPYVLVTYVAGKNNERKRKIRLRDTAIRRNTPEDLAKQITFSIEEFKGEIDSVEMG